MLESFGQWLADPCGKLLQPLLVRGTNYYIGTIPDRTPKSTLPMVLLRQSNDVVVNPYTPNFFQAYFQLVIYGLEFFEALDYAKRLYNTFAHIKGAVIPDIDVFDEDGNTVHYYYAASVTAQHPQHIGRDDKARYIFAININMLVQHIYGDLEQPEIPEGYIPIYTIEELQLIGNNDKYPVDGNYWLGNDIDASDTFSWNYNEEEDYYEGFEPIGREGLEFQGNFEGNGYIIYNLYINRPTLTICGLFRVCLMANIRNLGVIGYVRGYDATGILAGVAVGRTQISNCYTMGTSWAGSGVGGVVGTIPPDFASAHISNCWSGATVRITEFESAGGIVGYCDGTITNCMSYGQVSCDAGDTVGGICGVATARAISNASGNYWDTTSSGVLTSALGDGYDSWDMADPATYVGWDTDAVWTWTRTYGYPRLRRVGLAPTFYPITKPQEIAKINKSSTGIDGLLWPTNRNYALRRNINMLDVSTMPIGYVDDVFDWTDVYNNAYRGIFDGQGYVISNIDIDNEDRYGVGLFGVLLMARVIDLGVLDATFKGNVASGALAGIVLFDTVIERCYADSCNVSAQDFGGGLVGSIPEYLGDGEIAKIDDSYARCNVIVDFGGAGGLVGYNSGHLTNTYSTSYVECGEYVPDYPKLRGVGTSPDDWPDPPVIDHSVGWIPIQGTNAQMLATLQSMGETANLGNKYYLTANIDASDTATWNAGAGFVPVGTGTGTGRFTGQFDGNGFVITGLVCNRTANVAASDYQGLFGSTNGATITSLRMADAAIAGRGWVGAGVGRVTASTMSCSAAVGGTVSGTVQFTGGLVGENHLASTISMCFAACAVSGGIYVGGFVGRSVNASTILYCYSTGAVIGSESRIGGFIGKNQSGSVATNCYATGAVTGGTITGGFCGRNNASTIRRCYSVGAVSASSGGIGGLVALNDGTAPVVEYSYYDSQTSGQSDTGRGDPKTTAEMKTRSTYYTWDFTDIWAMDAVEDYYVGGLIALASPDQLVAASYWDTDTSQTLISDGGTGKTTAEMQQQSTYTGWDFDEIWLIQPSNYPTFKEVELV